MPKGQVTRASEDPCGELGPSVENTALPGQPAGKEEGAVWIPGSESPRLPISWLSLAKLNRNQKTRQPVAVVHMGFLQGGSRMRGGRGATGRTELPSDSLHH